MKLRFPVLAALLVVVGCTKEIPGITCNGDADCPDGKCIDGICAEPNNPDASTHLDASVPDGGPKCSKDGDCPKCEKCNAGKCAFQSEAEDLKDECAALDCSSGNCDGAGKCGVKAVETVCRQATKPCDVAEVCNGVDAECPEDEFEPDTKECRASRDTCDVAELCTGSSADCPDDKFAPSTLECRMVAGDCDVAEFCTGLDATCPTDKFKDSSVVCRGTSGNDCDKAENCTGTSVECPADGKQPDGFIVVAEKCEVSTHTPAKTCDGKGVLRNPAPNECAPYACGATDCKAACNADTDCTTFCDPDLTSCVANPTQVDCTDPTMLQKKIDDAAICPINSSRCYLEVSGTCRNIAVKGKDVFIKHGTIDPSSTGGSIAAAVFVEEAATATTRLRLSEVTVQGALGTLATGAHGISSQGTGNPVGQPEVFLDRAVIGTPGAGNPGHGIKASESALFISSSTIQNNTGAGVSATNSPLTVASSIIQNNTGAGVSCADGDAAITATRIQDNALAGIKVSSSSQHALAISNCIMAGNGEDVPDDDGAGARIDIPDLTASSFAHNTVVANGKVGGTQVGVKCITAKLPLANSIVWANTGAEVVGCGGDSTSHVEGSTTAESCGVGALPDLASDNRLNSTSLCKDKVACILAVPTDIEGQARPYNNSCDVGADEFWP